MEKNIVRGSYVMLILITTTFLSNVPLVLKIINGIFLAPTVAIILENFQNRTRFVVSINLLEGGNNIEVLNHKGVTEIMKINDLSLASEDPRVAQKTKLNHETYLIFSCKANTNLYHIFRAGAFLDEKLLEKLLEGKDFNNLKL